MLSCMSIKRKTTLRSSKRDEARKLEDNNNTEIFQDDSDKKQFGQKKVDAALQNAKKTLPTTQEEDIKDGRPIKKTTRSISVVKPDKEEDEKGLTTKKATTMASGGVNKDIGVGLVRGRGGKSGIRSNAETLVGVPDSNSNTSTSSTNGWACTSCENYNMLSSTNCESCNLPNKFATNLQPTTSLSKKITLRKTVEQEGEKPRVKKALPINVPHDDENKEKGMKRKLVAAHRQQDEPSKKHTIADKPEAEQKVLKKPRLSRASKRDEDLYESISDYKKLEASSESTIKASADEGAKKKGKKDAGEGGAKATKAENGDAKAAKGKKEDATKETKTKKGAKDAAEEGDDNDDEKPIKPKKGAKDDGAKKKTTKKEADDEVEDGAKEKTAKTKKEADSDEAGAKKKAKKDTADGDSKKAKSKQDAHDEEGSRLLETEKSEKDFRKQVNDVELAYPKDSDETKLLPNEVQSMRLGILYDEIKKHEHHLHAHPLSKIQEYYMRATKCVGWTGTAGIKTRSYTVMRALCMATHAILNRGPIGLVKSVQTDCKDRSSVAARVLGGIADVCKTVDLIMKRYPFCHDEICAVIFLASGNMSQGCACKEDVKKIIQTLKQNKMLPPWLEPYFGPEKVGLYTENYLVNSGMGITVHTRLASPSYKTLRGVPATPLV